MFNGIRRAITLSRQRSREENGLPFTRQLREMILLQMTTRLGPGNYHKYRLWQKDISWEEKKGYWNDQKYYDFLNKVNPYKYRIIARNKIVAKCLTNFYGIKDAKSIAHLSSQGMFSAHSKELGSLASFGEVLENQRDLKKICFKPVEGSSGEGFCAADVIRGDTIRLRPLDSENTFSVYDFIQKRLGGVVDNDYIVEEYVDQHPLLSSLNQSSLNTLRVWVGKSVSGVTKIPGMYLRVGRQGSLIDNNNAGGVAINVNLESFKTERAVTIDDAGHFFCEHPDSGVPLSGIHLPFFDKVVKLSERVINVLPGTRFIGLDIAFSHDGPLLIEFNLTPSPIAALFYQRGHSDLIEWLLD